MLGGTRTNGAPDGKHHEGVRDGRRQSPDYLQLDRSRESGIRTDRWRQHPDLHRFTVAATRRPASLGPNASGVAVETIEDRHPSPQLGDLRALLHRLNNQLGVILAHAELLESKAPDDAHRARASHVVGATLEALSVTRVLGDQLTAEF